MILRPVGGSDYSEDMARWTFVGEYYVHGIMNGEAMTPAEDDPSILSTFDIC